MNQWLLRYDSVMSIQCFNIGFEGMYISLVSLSFGRSEQNKSLMLYVHYLVISNTTINRLPSKSR